MRHLLNPLDFSVEETGQLLDLADNIEHHLSEYSHVCDGKKLATLFYEPSTRTRLSFEAAMLNLGGSVLGFSERSPFSRASAIACTTAGRLTRFSSSSSAFNFSAPAAVIGIRCCISLF